MNSPFFSVVIPLYNKEQTILTTIQSVLCQTFQDFEIVVVNDGSKDNGPYIVQQLSHPKIRVEHQENAGVSSARNRGVLKAQGEYIAFLDGDDIWKENHLGELYSLIKEFAPGVKLFTTNFALSFPNGDTFVNRTDLPRGVLPSFFKACMRKAVLNSSCACIQREVLLTMGGFKTQYTIGEDLELWNRLARKYQLAYSPIVTSIYQMDAPNNSRQHLFNYKGYAAKDALKGISFDFYDIIFSLKWFLSYWVRKILHSASLKDLLKK